MFRSKRREVIFPQSEHLRLAGTLAWLYGNAEFEMPPIPRQSFIAGVAYHDRGYGFLDTLPIGETAETEWLAVTWKSFTMNSSDPVADMMIKFHLRRLVTFRDTEARKALLRRMDDVIEEQLRERGFSREEFQRIDRITDFCDSVSFAFCFEEPKQGHSDIFPNVTVDQKISISFRVDGERIAVSPWPFSVERYDGYITAYRAEGYPVQPDPIIVPFELVNSTT